MQSYARIIIKENKQTLWNLEIPQVEKIAGMYAAFLASKRTLTDRYDFETNVNIDDFIVAKDMMMTTTNLPVYAKLMTKKLAVWLKSDKDAHYTLWQMNNSDFIEGLISYCDNMKVIAENLFLGKLFDKNGNNYVVPFMGMDSHKVTPQFGYKLTEDYWGDPNEYAPYYDDIDNGERNI